MNDVGGGTFVAGSGKQRLLALLNEEAQKGPEARHEATDDGFGYCSECGRGVDMYPVPGRPDRDPTLQHVRTGRRGRKVGLGVPEIATRLGMDEHEATHLLWSLQKEAKVTFRERNRGTPGHIELDAIKLTWIGAAAVQKPQDAPEVYQDFVGPDLIDAEPVTTVTPSLPELELPIVFEGTLPEKYPLLTALQNRANQRRAVEDAARILEAVQLEEISLQVLESVPTDTPLEREMLRFIREVTRKLAQGTADG